MTAESLLAVKRPEQIYTGDPDTAKREFRALAQEWHPDKNRDPRAVEVFQHVKALYEQALLRLDTGTWEGKGAIRFFEKYDGKSRLVEYHASHPFELGQLYVGDHHVTYMLDKKHEELWRNAVGFTKPRFQYASAKMKEEISKYLPSDVIAFKTKADHCGLIVPKTEDLLLLRDVLDHFKKTGPGMPPKHMAWVQSSLHNLVCYLHFAGFSHQNISPDTYFISPKFHGGALLGGWWYAARFGEKVSRVPARTFDCLPWDVRVKKKASPLTDLELVRATGRELLGDLSGTKLDPNLPERFKSWFRSAASGSAVDNYRDWRDTLEASLGPRRFTPMELDAKTLYQTARAKES